MYAETLRFGVQIHIPRSAPHRDVQIGGVAIPKDKLAITNTWLAHSDEQVWNTREGEKPLDTFWPERFLVDDRDERSGPVRVRSTAEKKDPAAAKDHVYFSAEGLEGAWIPYGGMPRPVSASIRREQRTKFLYRWSSRLPGPASCQAHHDIIRCPPCKFI